MFCTDTYHKQPLGEVLHSVEICFVTSLLNTEQCNHNLLAYSRTIPCRHISSITVPCSLNYPLGITWLYSITNQILWINFIFDRWHRSVAVVTHVKYEHDVSIGNCCFHNSENLTAKKWIGWNGLSNPHRSLAGGNSDVRDNFPELFALK